MAPTESIRSGGLEYEAAWVRCRVSASFKPGEAFVLIDAEGVADQLAFYVDATLVQPSAPPTHEVDGKVKVMLLGRQNGTVLIQVLGESVSYGPKISISRELLSDDLVGTR